MNKEIIYIEPEDDITDVIAHIKAAKERIVALVPPKKLGVLRSTINIKLISRAAKQSDKTVVIVTTDASIMKLAGANGIPVAKTLQSRPIIPRPEDIEKPAAKVETMEEDEEVISDTPEKNQDKTPKNVKKSEKSSGEKSNSKKSKLESKKSKIPNLDKYRKFIIAGAAAFVVLIGFLIWAIGFSGAADITVKIRTSSSSFAESVSFVTNQDDVDAEHGKFRLEKVEFVKESTTEFEPTGEKDFGNKASGKVQVQTSIDSSDIKYVDGISTTIAAGAKFTLGDTGLTYASTENVDISWDGKSGHCPSPQGFICVITVDVPVMATEGGTDHNIEASQPGWKTSITNLPGIVITNPTAFSGGSTDKKKVVTKEDIEKATKELGSTADGKDKLLEKVSEDVIVIDSSYKADPTDPVSSPAVNEQASGKAKLTAKTTYSVYVVDKNAIKEYVKSATKDSLGSDQIVYDIGSPFFERFTEQDKTFTAKLKSTIKTGPKVTEDDILEKALGKKVGEVQSLLQSINGVSSVKIDTSFFWVHTIPNDKEKVKISIEVEEE